MGKSRNAYRVLVGRPEGKRPLGRPRRRWEDNIKMDLREVGYDDRDWINLAQDRNRWRAYVRAAMNLRVPYKPFKMVAEKWRADLSVTDLAVDIDLPIYTNYPDSVTTVWKSDSWESDEKLPLLTSTGNASSWQPKVKITHTTSKHSNLMEQSVCEKTDSMTVLTGGVNIPTVRGLVLTNSIHNYAEESKEKVPLFLILH
ncbi:hypothetical protein ANN_01531 [Periplaneta americana]|uniref:Uncharacterized protein n=1 Tax=Periplaneta americana TaxID=6978 RepID=A0ABQ8TX77_PERAM|nr:hypothetical protein ANN_01531 [Periplaneta americana]